MTAQAWRIRYKPTRRLVIGAIDKPRPKPRRKPATPQAKPEGSRVR
jgi:hypothetical protein